MRKKGKRILQKKWGRGRNKGEENGKKEGRKKNRKEQDLRYNQDIQKTVCDL